MPKDGIPLSEFPPSLQAEYEALPDKQTDDDTTTNTEGVPTYDTGGFPLPNHHYDAPVDAKHKANRMGLDGEYHVVKINGTVRYVPGDDINTLRNTIGEDPTTNLETSEYATYDAGAKVMLENEDAMGTIVELHTSEFSLGDTTFEGSQDEPLYVVATDQATYIVDESEIRQENWESVDESDDAEPTPEALAEDGEMNENYANIEGTTDPHPDQTPTVNKVNEIQGEIDVGGAGTGFDSYPDSWEESDTPARMILLDAWASMGASFDGCQREMRGEIGRTAPFCAAMKDEVYGTTSWR